MFVLSLPRGKICNEDRNELPPNGPSPVHSAPQSSSDDWFPYKSHVQFELANFLYRCNQMSQGDTDILLNLINAMLTSHGNHAPFENHSDMHNTIDATTLGEAPWDHFTLSYNGPLPEGVSREDIPGWMTEEHEESGFATQWLSWKICIQILTSRISLIILHIKNIQWMGYINSVTSCQGTGHGNRQWVYYYFSIYSTHPSLHRIWLSKIILRQ